MAWFVRAVLGAALLAASVGPTAAVGAGPSAAAGPSPGDGVDLGRAEADLRAASPSQPLESRETRIAGGTATTIQNWPWQVAPGGAANRPVSRPLLLRRQLDTAVGLRDRLRPDAPEQQ